MSRSSPLRAKQALFDDWGLSDDEDTKVPLSIASFASVEVAESVVKKENDKDEEENQANVKPELSDAEVEHRRKSRAFAVAAKAALDEEERRKRKKAEKRELKERQRREEELREQEEERRRLEEQRLQEERSAKAKRPLPQVIDLTGPRVTPIPPPQVPPQIPPPPRRSQSAVEYMRKSATLRRTSSNPLPTSQTGQASKKRKTESAASSFTSITSIASNLSSASASASTSTSTRNIFSGLSFYYLPDAALGARKLRIAKAQQHGATWVRNLEEATHVIVDKPFKWIEIASAVEGRRPDAIIVYDEYPLDCIGFRCLLNPAQRRYQISGRDAETIANNSTETASTEKKDIKKEESYTIKPPSGRLAAGSSSRSHEREQMIRQPRKGG